jgi:hypothetical protein
MRSSIAAWTLGLGLVGLAAETPAPLHLEGFDALGRARLTQTNAPTEVARLEGSNDLAHWSELARLHGAFHRFPDLRAPSSQHFYRTLLSPRTSADDWKNHAAFPEDPLLSPPPAWDRFEPRWLKFAILKAEPHRVYFQDSTKYPFHYDFAVARLPAFRGFTRAEFDAVSLRRAPQQVLLGAILYAPSDQLPEIGVQFVGQDPYPREEIAAWFEQVRAVIEPRAPASFFYFPTYEQQAAADAHRDYLATRGITVASAARWVTADECYAPGWALGRLVFVPAGEIRSAYSDGRLRPHDILLTDHVPAEVPPLAGLVTLSPATPNSHVALLAQSFGIPFVYFSAAAARDELQAWTGQEIALRATLTYGACSVTAVNIEGQLAAPTRDEILALKVPPTLDLTPKATAGTFSLPADPLRPADLRFVGGKAANFGLLRRALPTNSPSPALAFTFDLWDAFLDQTLPDGRTLRATIQAELDGVTWPPDMASLQDRLARLRATIRDTADFSPTQEQAILEVLQAAGFDPNRNIRFRSSTNVEDSEQFSGAGLYDSYSGCLADDLDADRDGPSACDPTEPRERGVFRALRRVYASFYNDVAYLERLRHRVDETAVGMAVLVHYSTPDPFELANGVATAAIRRGSQPSERWVDWQLITQSGALPVTNPEPNALPEDVRGSLWGATDPWLTLARQSSLLPLGATVFTWPADYVKLVRLLDLAARAYETEFPARSELTLDFEYKQLAPQGTLEVRQVREVPRPPSAGDRPAWLLNQTNRWTVFQGEYGDVFAHHRLKSSWTFQTASFRLTGNPLTETFYHRLETELIEAGQPTRRGGPVPELPDFHHHRDGADRLDEWTWGSGPTQRRFQLRSSLPTAGAAVQTPLLFLSDGALQLQVTYTTPQLTLGATAPTNTLADLVTLRPLEPVSPRSLRQQRRLAGKGLTIETTFYWPPNPTGPVAGYTAPVQAWIETRLTGLLPQTIVLRGDYSQSYRPGHHNFVEDFVFDPHLEPGLDPATLAELTARNIRAIVGQISFDQTLGLWIWGQDDRLRELP